MLHSLEIRNYRNLRHLTIEKLGRVNLLVGKNNTGKTSVLEALAIYASSRDEMSTIKSLLQRRGEFYVDSSRNTSYTENNLTSLKALYTNYNPQFFPAYDNDSDIYIGEYLEAEDFGKLSLSIGLRTAYRTSRIDESGREISEYVSAEKEEDIEQREFRYEIKLWRNYLRLTTYSINNQLLFMDSPRRSSSAPDQFQYVDSKNQTQQSVENLYSKIALSEKEDEVIKALKIIEPQIERFSLVEENRPIIKFSNGKIRNLSSMGDGISRIFAVILSMVNCEGTYLLIDEFENGLHFSVQEKLWEIIFYLAERLNIQVFATTHSNDTIKAFGEISNLKPEYNDSQLIQLRNVKGEISAVLFNAQDVEVAIETDYLDLR